MFFTSHSFKVLINQGTPVPLLAPERRTSPQGMGLQSRMRHTQPRPPLGCVRLSPFSPHFSPPQARLAVGGCDADFCTAKSNEPEHLVFTQHSQEHPSPCEPAPVGLSVPCRDPFKAVKSTRVRVPPALLSISPNFLFSCLYKPTYFYMNKTSDYMEDLLMPELAKQTNHRPVTLNPLWGYKSPTAAAAGMFQEDSGIVPVCDVWTPRHTGAMGWIPLQRGSPSALGSLSSPKPLRKKSPCWISPQRLETPQCSHSFFDHAGALTSE